MKRESWRPSKHQTTLVVVLVTALITIVHIIPRFSVHVHIHILIHIIHVYVLILFHVVGFRFRFRFGFGFTFSEFLGVSFLTRN